MASIFVADPAAICTTSSIPQLSIRELFSRPAISREPSTSKQIYQTFTIPIFQRRFCWGKQHLQKLLVDITKECSKPLADGMSSSMLSSPPISFGRIVVATVENKVMVIDGQQRLTSLCLLFASTRDFIIKYLSNNKTIISDPFHSSLKSLAAFCNANLHPSSDTDINTDTENNSYILEPTYFDRASFHFCMRDVQHDHETDDCGKSVHIDAGFSMKNVKTNESDESDHILQAKMFFDQTFSHGSLLRVIWMKMHPPFSRNSHIDEQSPTFVLSTCASLVQTILDKIGVLYFDVDKTNDVQSVYERLAMREALLEPDLFNDAPGVLMRESDLVRNLVTSYSSDVDSQIHTFKTYWVPIERLTIKKSLPIAGSTVRVPLVNIQRLDSCICAFLDSLPAERAAVVEEGETSCSAPSGSLCLDPGIKCFPLYQKLRTCIHRSLLARNIVPEPLAHGQQHCKEIENIVILLLQDIYAFAEKYFDEYPENNDDTICNASSKESIGSAAVALKEFKTKELPCPCFQRGTLCTDCIIKKYASNKK